MCQTQLDVRDGERPAVHVSVGAVAQVGGDVHLELEVAGIHRLGALRRVGTVRGERSQPVAGDRIEEIVAALAW